MKKKGSVTIFISLLSLIILILFQIMLYSIQIQGGKIQAVTGVEEGLYSAFAEYDRELLQQYHVFFMDGGYGTDTFQAGNIFQTIENCVELSCNTEKTLLGGNGENICKMQKKSGCITAYTLASDQMGRAFKTQAIDYMKSTVGLQEIQLLLKGAQNEKSVKQDEYTDSTVRKVENAQNAYAQAKQQAEETDLSQKDVTNPLDIVRQLQSKGILTLVLPEGTNVSSVKVLKNMQFSNRECERGIGVPYFGTDSNTYLDQILFREYILKHLAYYGVGEKEQYLNYQIEYVICGKESDLENLKGVANRLLAMREAANMTYLMSDPVCQTQIHELALAISMTVGTPALEGVISLALEAAWAFGESLLDIKILFDGGEVPLIKNSTNWNLPLENLVNLPTLLKEKSTYDCKGMNYQEYLRAMLLMENAEKQVLRTMDVIEQVIKSKEGKEQFRWDLCLSYLEVQFEFICCDQTFSVNRNYGYEM